MVKFSSFWGEIETANEAPAPTPTAKEDTPADVVETNTEEEEESEEEESSEEVKGTSTEPPKVTPTSTEQEEPLEYTDEDIQKAYTILLDEGILEEEEEDDFDISPAGLADKVASAVRKKVQTEFDSIPAVVNDFYTHILEGNDPREFKPNVPIQWGEFSLEDEESQKAALRIFYKRQKMSDEDIEEEIADLETTGKLEKKAGIAVEALTEQQKAQDLAQSKAMKEADEARKKAQQTEIDGIHKSIDDTDELAGFKLDDKKKQGFKDYLFKVNPRTGKTKMQENMASEERRMTIAFLDYMNYTKADLAKEVATDLTRTRKKKLTRFSSSTVKNTSASSVKTRTDAKKGKIKFPTIFGSTQVELED